MSALTKRRHALPTACEFPCLPFLIFSGTIPTPSFLLLFAGSLDSLGPQRTADRAQSRTVQGVDPPTCSFPSFSPPSLPPFLSLSHTLASRPIPFLPAPYSLFCSCPLPTHAYGSPFCFLSAQINQKAGIKPCPSEVQAAVREAESETSFNPVKCECRRVLYFSHAFFTFVSDSLRII